MPQQVTLNKVVSVPSASPFPPDSGHISVSCLHPNPQYPRNTSWPKDDSPIRLLAELSGPFSEASGVLGSLNSSNASIDGAAREPEAIEVFVAEKNPPGQLSRRKNLRSPSLQR